MGELELNPNEKALAESGKIGAAVTSLHRRTTLTTREARGAVEKYLAEVKAARHEAEHAQIREVLFPMADASPAYKVVITGRWFGPDVFEVAATASVDGNVRGSSIVREVKGREDEAVQTAARNALAQAIAARKGN